MVCWLFLLAYVYVLLKHLQNALAPGLADPQPRVEYRRRMPGVRSTTSAATPEIDVLRPGKHMAHDAATQELAHRLHGRVARTGAARS